VPPLLYDFFESNEIQKLQRTTTAETKKPQLKSAAFGNLKLLITSTDSIQSPQAWPLTNAQPVALLPQNGRQIAHT